MISDLHTHSTCSDGSFSVGEIIDLAKHIGLDCIALTDHDTTVGVDFALSYGKEVGLHIIPAIELSADSGTPVHVLGYNINYKDSDFQSILTGLQAKREARKDKILAKLSEYNINLDPSKLPAVNVGRSHIARELRDQGYVSTIQEAFDRYIGEHRLAYFPGSRMSPLEAVSVIAKYGGQPVLAHPLKLYQNGKLDDMIKGLIPYGLVGLECYYPSHSVANTKFFLNMASQYGLFATGGSDFHGVIKGQGNMLGVIQCELPQQLLR